MQNGLLHIEIRSYNWSNTVTATQKRVSLAGVSLCTKYKGLEALPASDHVYSYHGARKKSSTISRTNPLFPAPMVANLMMSYCQYKAVNDITSILLTWEKAIQTQHWYKSAYKYHAFRFWTFILKGEKSFTYSSLKLLIFHLGPLHSTHIEGETFLSSHRPILNPLSRPHSFNGKKWPNFAETHYRKREIVFRGGL